MQNYEGIMQKYNKKQKEKKAGEKKAGEKKAGAAVEKGAPQEVEMVVVVVVVVVGRDKLVVIVAVQLEMRGRRITMEMPQMELGERASRAPRRRKGNGSSKQRPLGPGLLRLVLDFLHGPWARGVGLVLNCFFF